MAEALGLLVAPTPAGAVYNQRPAQKRRSGPTAPKVPMTLRDLGGEAALAAAGSRRAKSKGTLAKISEAAEWADESTQSASQVDDELEELWAEAGLAGGSAEADPRAGRDSGSGRQSGRSGVASTAAAALAAASAARKAGVGVGSTSSSMGLASLSKGADPARQGTFLARSEASATKLAEEDAGVQLQVLDSAEERVECSKNTSGLSASSSASSSASGSTKMPQTEEASSSESSEEETSEEEVEVMTEVAMPSRARAELPAHCLADSAAKAATGTSEISGVDLTLEPASLEVNSQQETARRSSSQATPPTLGLLDLMGTAVASVERSASKEAKREAGVAHGAASGGLLGLMDTAVASVERSASKEAKREAGVAHGAASGGLLDLMGAAVASVEQSASKEAKREAGVAHGAASGGLQDLMGTAVASVEQSASKGANREAGVAHGAASGGSRPLGRIVGRADVLEAAVKKSAGSCDSHSSVAAPKAQARPSEPMAPAKPALGSFGLQGLRQAYGTGMQPQVTVAGPCSVAREAASQQQEPDASSNRDSDDGIEDEWEEIAQRTDELAAEAKANQGRLVAQQDVMSQAISYKEVSHWLQHVDVDVEAIRPFTEDIRDEGQCGCMTRRRAACDIPGLDRKMCSDKDLILHLKMKEFDFNEITHHRMLRTMYTKLSRNKVCPTIGRHWEVLGFQGGDPRTDLNRSGGVLNVMHMFFFFSHFFELFKAAYRLAQDAEQNFPLACVSINITRMAVDCLLAGRLSKLCNGSDKGVFEIVCRVYSGGLFHFYSRWRSQKRTIKDTQLTFSEVRELMEKRPARLVEGLDKGVEELHAKSDATRFEFTALEFCEGGGSQPQGRTAAATASAIPKRLRNYQETGDAPCAK